MSASTTACRASTPAPTDAAPGIVFPDLERCLLWSDQVDTELPGLRRKLAWTHTPAGERAVVLTCANGTPLTSDGLDVLMSVVRQHGLSPVPWPPPPGPAIPPALERWLEALYGDLGGQERIECRFFAPGQRREAVFCASVAEAARTIVSRRGAYNCYTGQAVRGPRHRGGGKDNCRRSNVVWAELDVKNWGGDSTAALRHLITFPLRIPIIISSGGGFHIQIPLAEPLDLTDVAHRNRLEALNRHLASAISAGRPHDNISDVARILRPPATINHKYDPRRPVEVVRLATRCRYDSGDLAAWLEQHHPLPPDPAPEPRPQPQRQQDGLIAPWDDWQNGTSWEQELRRDGWSYVGQRGGQQLWTRPGKSPRDGHSLTLRDDGVAYNFSSSVPNLPANEGFGLWAYHVYTRYGGDFSAAARAKSAEGYGTLGAYARAHGCSLAQAARTLADARSAPSSTKGTPPSSEVQP